jgi:hypothetical protein
VVSRLTQGEFRVDSQWTPGESWVVSGTAPGDFQVDSKWFPGRIRVGSGWFGGFRVGSGKLYYNYLMVRPTFFFVTNPILAF